MDESKVKAYLERIGYEGEVRPDEETLARLIRLHLEQVSFENLDAYDYGIVPELSEEYLYEKIVVQRRGGWCFELNRLFGALLDALGFEVYPVAARILLNKPTLPPATHMMLIAVIGREKYLCDVGYGGPGPKGLTAIREGEQHIGGSVYRVRRIAEKAQTNVETHAVADESTVRSDGPEIEPSILLEWLHDGVWRRMIRLEDRPAELVDFELPNFYCAKCEKVIFSQKRILNLCTPTGSKALAGMELTVRDSGEITTHRCADEQELRQVLQGEFGIDIRRLPPLRCNK